MEIMASNFINKPRNHLTRLQGLEKEVQDHMKNLALDRIFKKHRGLKGMATWAVFRDEVRYMTANLSELLPCNLTLLTPSQIFEAFSLQAVDQIISEIFTRFPEAKSRIGEATVRNRMRNWHMNMRRKHVSTVAMCGDSASSGRLC